MKFFYFIQQFINNRKGFSLELPVYGITLGSLMTLSLTAPDIEGYMRAARDAKRAGDAHQIVIALELYSLDHGAYPQYTGYNHQASWIKLRTELEPRYVQILPDDPKSQSLTPYHYWSDGSKAKIYYFSETDNAFKERWAF